MRNSPSKFFNQTIMEYSRHITGRTGEDIAADYVKQMGFFIAHRNFRCRYGEIDIIAENREYILFIEVKVRAKSAGYFPREAVTEAKKRKIIMTAKNYIFKSHLNLQPRFDVAEIITPEPGVFQECEINYIENAFSVKG